MNSQDDLDYCVLLHKASLFYCGLQVSFHHTFCLLNYNELRLLAPFRLFQVQFQLFDAIVDRLKPVLARRMFSFFHQQQVQTPFGLRHVRACFYRLCFAIKQAGFQLLRDKRVSRHIW